MNGRFSSTVTGGKCLLGRPRALQLTAAHGAFDSTHESVDSSGCVAVAIDQPNDLGQRIALKVTAKPECKPCPRLVPCCVEDLRQGSCGVEHLASCDMNGVLPEYACTCETHGTFECPRGTCNLLVEGSWKAADDAFDACVAKLGASGCASN